MAELLRELAQVQTSITRGADDELRRASVLEAQNLEHVHVAGERKIDARRQLALPLCQCPLERLVELEIPADTPDRRWLTNKLPGAGRRPANWAA
jgi:hypothetical protein